LCAYWKWGCSQIVLLSGRKLDPPFARFYETLIQFGTICGAKWADHMIAFAFISCAYLNCSAIKGKCTVCGMSIKTMTVKREIYLTAWSKVLLEKTIIAQLVKKFLPFMELEGALPCLQNLVTAIYPKPDGSNIHP
jgi:hypothetical protein